jgi:hypothetical protein
MVNINGPTNAAAVGPLNTAARRPALASSPPPPVGSRNSTPALPPSFIAHGAQVHVVGGGAATQQHRPLPPPAGRSVASENGQKIR